MTPIPRVVQAENQRIKDVRLLMREQEIEALLVTTPPNRRYLSGFSGSAGSLLITATHALIFTDFRYRVQVEREAPSFTLHEVSHTNTLSHIIPRMAAELGVQQIAFESQNMTVATHQRLVAEMARNPDYPAPTLHGVEGLVEILREVKDSDEIVALRQAIEITDSALAAVLPHLRPDQTERQAAWMLEVAMRERGADRVSFPIIVAAGTNTAMPHARPGDSLLGSGCPIVIDMGACLNGYHADLTRTVVLGEPDTRFWTIYHTVLEAQQRAITAIRVGITGAEADAIARDAISAAGFGDAFGHGLGHGVGLDIHEAPRLGPASENTLCAGNVFSVEPGIYLEDWGGVRIEDLVVLHETGCELLSQAPRQPVVTGL